MRGYVRGEVLAGEFDGGWLELIGVENLKKEMNNKITKIIHRNCKVAKLGALRSGGGFQLQCVGGEGGV